MNHGLQQEVWCEHLGNVGMSNNVAYAYYKVNIGIEHLLFMIIPSALVLNRHGAHVGPKYSLELNPSKLTLDL